jgi:SAM-dependent methyltransferase
MGGQAKYYESASLSTRFYDTITAVDPCIRGDIDYYASLASLDQMILDLGCGTGRVALELVQRGFRVTAVDSSVSMLARAHANAAQLPPGVRNRLTFALSDLRDISLALPVPLAVVPYYTFNHLPDQQQRERALENIARLLHADGLLVIHSAGEDSLRVAKSHGTGQSTFEFTNGFRLEVTWGDRHLDEVQRKTTINIQYRLIDAESRETAASLEQLTLYWFTPVELERAAAQHGLRLLDMKTSFQDAVGDERIYVLQKGR